MLAAVLAISLVIRVPPAAPRFSLPCLEHRKQPLPNAQQRNPAGHRPPRAVRAGCPDQ